MSGHIFVVQPGASPLNISNITRQGNDIALTWLTSGLCKTNALQRASGAVDGSFTNNYTDIFIVTNTVGSVTNYVDIGAVTNLPASYYRVWLVP